MRKKKIPLVAVILTGLLAVCLATGAIGVRVDTEPAATYEMLTHAASLARAEKLDWLPADTVETLPRREALTAEELLARLTAAGYTGEEAAALLGLPEGMQVRLVLALGEADEKRRIVERRSDGNLTYYRDENDEHCVPKITLDEAILLKK